MHVIQVLEELLVQASDAAQEAAVVLMHLEQHRRRKVAHDLMDIRVERKTREQRQVEREMRRRAVGFEQLGERCEEHRRRRHAMRGSPVPDPLPELSLQPTAAGPKAHGRGAAGIFHERQLRRPRQCVEARIPVGLRTAVLLGVTKRNRAKHVVAERERRHHGLQVGVVVVRTPVAENLEQRGRVGRDQVDAEVNPDPIAIAPGQSHVEQRPLVRCEDLVRHLLADGVTRAFLEDHSVGRHLGQDALASVIEHHRAEHVVAFDHALPGPLESIRVEPGTFEFRVDVTADAPERQRGTASDPVRLLDIGQRERFVPSLRIGRDPRARRLPQDLACRPGRRLDHSRQLADAPSAQDCEW